METTIDSRRELAIRRIKAKSDFRIHVVSYLAVNVMLVLVWFIAAATLGGPFTFFWPILSIAGWGAGLIIHAYVVYNGDAYTEERVDREMKAMV